MRTLTNVNFSGRWRLLLPFIVAGVSLLTQAKAQVSAYPFTQSSGTYSAITGGTVLGNTSSDDQRFVDPAVPLGGTATTGPGFPIGFSFTYNGIAFDRVAINNNGWISLGQSSLTPSVDNASTSAYTPLSSTATNTPTLLRNRVAGLGADIQAQAGAELRIQTIGVAPNQVYVVQWTNYKRFSTAGTGHNLTFQIRLNEGGGVAANQTVEVVYGTMVFNATSSTAHVGLGGTVSTDFNNRATVAPHDWNNTIAGTANTSSCTFVNTGTPPVSGLTFTWTPPAACMGTPAGGTTTSTANPVCSGVNFTLGLNGATQGTGITYQWQSSPNGVTFTNVSGATNPTLTTSATATTWYQCIVTCTSSGQSATSTALQVNVTPEPVGNTFANPIVLGALPQTVSGNNLAANCWTSTYTGANAQASPDVFYRFQVTDCNDNIAVSLCGSPFDTYLHVLDATGTQIAFNDDNGPLCTGVASSVALTGLAIGTYYAVVEGFSTNTGTFTLAITTTDVTPPTIACPVNFITSNDLGLCSAAVAYTVTASDNCGATVTQNMGLASGSQFPVGTTTNSFTATDGAGLTAACSFTVTVTDDEAPEFTNCTDVEVGTSGGACSGVATFSISASDNCDLSVTVAQTGGPVSGSTFSIGTTPVSFSATDDAGNVADCAFNVIVSDDDGPTITTCPPNITIATNDNCEAVLDDYTSGVVATDNCGGSVTVTQSPAPGTVVGGFSIVTMIATDDSGNSSTCSFQTSSEDMSPPTISCPDTQEFIADDDCQTPLPDFTSLAIASDNCGGFVVTQSPAAGTLVGFGQTIVTLTVTDGPGFTASCTMLAYSIDVTPPVITCPPSVTLNTDPNTCTAVAMFMCPVAPDNCSGSANPEQYLGLPNGSSFPLGVNVVGFQATDASGNVSTCTFTITVIDIDPPYLSCPPNIVKSTDLGLCSAVTTWSAPTTHDNCDVPVLMQTGGLANGSAFPKGTTTVSFKSTDASGNSTTCSFTVTVNDNEAPKITCPASITVSNTLNQCGANVTYATPTFSDNCPGATIMLMSGLASGAFFPVGITTNVWKVTDASGNTATCSFTVRVNDTQLPVITCPANITVNNTPNQCGANVTYATPTFSDNCPGATIMLVSGLPSGSFFPVGVTTNVWKVTDASGNMATCSFTVRVNDVQAPVFTNCPGNITVVNDPGVCGAVVTWPKITATDNCPGVVVTFVSGMASGALFVVGTTTVIYKATDASGNMATCSFNVVVLDNETPSLTCPPDIVKNNDINQCSATIAFIGTPTATDNCGVASVTNNNTGNVYPVGVTIITWTAVDAAGNDVTCQQTITVVDYQPPLINCPDDIYTINDPNLPCQAEVDYSVTATDNCPGVTVVTTEWPPSEDGLYSIGTTMVIGTATDAAGNQVTCTFNIVVEPGVEICNGLDDDCDGFVDETTDEWRQADKQEANAGEAGDLYGTSVAVSGNYAVVGAKNSDANGTNSGIAYILYQSETDPDDWQQIAVLTPPQVEADDLFGSSAAIHTNFVVVGAPQDDDLGENAGAAYIFVKAAASNTWNLVKKITANDGFAGDNFGASVSVFGDKILVGASLNDEKGLNAGAAYLFGKDQGGTDNWGQLVKITAADGEAGDMFGANLELDGDFAVIGAALEDEKGMNAGAAYLFNKDQGGANAWGQVKKITANDGAAFDNFGVSVGINANAIIVGANMNDDNGTNSGSAYIFERNFGGTDNWGQATKLLANDGTASDQLGFAVAINGNFAVASARFDNIKGTNSGAAYVWQRQTNGFWEFVSKIHDNQGAKNDQFGSALDIYKRTIIVGALRDDVAGKTDQGSVSLFAAGCHDSFNGDPADNIAKGNTSTSVFEVKAYPQPFSDVLNIEVNVKAASGARVVIWNSLGEEVATVYNGTLEGNTILRWDAARFPVGTYFLRVEADNETEVKPLLLVR